MHSLIRNSGLSLTLGGQACACFVMEGTGFFSSSSSVQGAFSIVTAQSELDTSTPSSAVAGSEPERYGELSASVI